MGLSVILYVCVLCSLRRRFERLFHGGGGRHPKQIHEIMYKHTELWEFSCKSI